MKPSRKIIMAFVKDHYGDKYVIRGNEVCVPSNYTAKIDKDYKVGINLGKALVHDFYWGNGVGCSFHEFVKDQKGFESYDEVEEYLLNLMTQELRHMTVKEVISDSWEEQPVEKKKIIVTGLPTEAKPIDYHSTNPFISRFANYLLKRGINNDIAELYQLHYCLTGQYSGRIIIPFLENGQLIWFQSRSINDDVKLRYFNPPGVDKEMIVYNIDRLKHRAILVEGPFDAMTVDGQAIMGSAASEMQVSKILNKNPQEVIIVPDIDSKHNVGLDGALTTIGRFTAKGYKNVKVVFNLYGKDFNAIGKEKSEQLLELAVPWGIRCEMIFHKLMKRTELKDDSPADSI